MIASKQMTLSPAQHFDCHIMGLTLSVAASSARALVDPALAVRPKSERRPRRRAAAGVTERLRPAAHAMLSSPATRVRLDRDMMTPLGPDSRIELQRAARSSQRRGRLRFEARGLLVINSLRSAALCDRSRAPGPQGLRSRSFQSQAEQVSCSPLLLYIRIVAACQQACLRTFATWRRCMMMLRRRRPLPTTLTPYTHQSQSTENLTPTTLAGPAHAQGRTAGRCARSGAMTPFLGITLSIAGLAPSTARWIT